jgi:protein-S-isoprenylcysteine O-methyltransferase Ste14
MNASAKRRMPPLWIFMIVFITVYTGISLGLTALLKLPWLIPMSVLLGLIFGIPLVVLGISVLAWSVKTLSLKRAMGKELFLDKSESTLITDGPYAYTRNPLYLSALINLLGWFFILRLTPIGFLVIIFGIHFILVAKWEERELRNRFGREYIEYAKHVPLFFPRPTKYVRSDDEVE